MDDLPVSICIPDCLNKQIIILILIFYSTLPLLVSLKQRIIIKSNGTRRKLRLCFSWQNCHWLQEERDPIFFCSANLNPRKTDVFKFCTRTHLALSSLLWNSSISTAITLSNGNYRLASDICVCFKAELKWILVKHYSWHQGYLAYDSYHLHFHLPLRASSLMAFSRMSDPNTFPHRLHNEPQSSEPEGKIAFCKSFSLSEITAGNILESMSGEAISIPKALLLGRDLGLVWQV